MNPAIKQHERDIRAALAALPPGALAAIAGDLAIALTVAVSKIKELGDMKEVGAYFDLVTPAIGVGAHILLLEYLLIAGKISDEIARPN